MSRQKAEILVLAQYIQLNGSIAKKSDDVKV
jgi:ribosomal 50S subunit-recycling heat shock protein